MKPWALNPLPPSQAGCTEPSPCPGAPGGSRAWLQAPLLQVGRLHPAAVPAALGGCQGVCRAQGAARSPGQGSPKSRRTSPLLTGAERMNPLASEEGDLRNTRADWGRRVRLCFRAGEAAREAHSTIKPLAHQAKSQLVTCRHRLLSPPVPLAALQPDPAPSRAGRELWSLLVGNSRAKRERENPLGPDGAGVERQRSSAVPCFTLPLLPAAHLMGKQWAGLRDGQNLHPVAQEVSSLSSDPNQELLHRFLGLPSGEGARWPAGRGGCCPSHRSP